MSVTSEVPPEIAAVEAKIAAVEGKIAAVEAEIVAVKAEIVAVKADPSNLRLPGLEETEKILQQQLLELLKKENILRNAALQAALGMQQAQAAGVFKHPKLAFGDESMRATYLRMSRVEHGGACIGSVSRITDKGVCVGAYHVHVDEAGKYLTATAFGQDLQLLAGLPYYDIIFLQGPPGPAFEWTRAGLYVPGQEVMMLAHPQALEVDLKTTDPHESHGRITIVAITQEVAAADYHGAMPNSSGGSVLFNSNLFAGVHLGTSFHLDETHQPGPPEQSAERDRIDKDPHNMWYRASDKVQGGSNKRGQREQGSATSDSREALDDAVKRLEHMTLHSVANIRHKDQVALFVPAPTVAQLATRAKLIGADALAQKVSKLSNRS